MSDWTPFRRCGGLVADAGGVTGTLFENSRYQVILREHAEGV